jgi:hypothetical protein
MSNQVEEDDSVPFRLLVPIAGAEVLEDFLKTARSLTADPFAAERVAVLEALSQALFSHVRLRSDSAGAALGFWLRRANLARLEADFRAHTARAERVPAGLVFHIAPANVDTMFAYSWALSFLSGNANVVRLTTRRSPLMSDLLTCLDALFVTYRDACRGNLFVTYSHDDAVTARLSAACDTRVVWGGDDTVRRLRGVPLDPHAAERSFASKRSLSVISTGSYLAADEADRRQVAERMATDLAPFGQMACSSPHVVYWIGSAEECRRALHDFENRLQPAMEAKIGEADLGWAVRRVNFAFDLAAKGRVTELSHQPHTTHVLAFEATQAEPVDPCGVGLLNHAMVESLDAISPLLRKDHQTITYFGLSEADRDRLGQQAGRAGVDRVVPVGHALDFGPYWDGYCLWDDFTRVVVVE